MKKLIYLLLSLTIMATVSCKKDDGDGNDVDPPVTNNNNIEVSGNITSNTTWEAGKKYLLKGNVFVQAPAELTIQPGTIIMGDKASKGALIISRGAKIHAQGAPDKPIVFTSSAPAGYRNRGDWGGVVILGRANNNSNINASIEGITPSGSTESGVYGGTDDSDNSGELTYARIEFAGIALSPNNELNSLTLGSVGSGTQIHHIQVSYGGDDSFEWFGGTSNHKYLVSYQSWDDDFDTDRGFSGAVQYALVVRDPSNADNSGSNAFEASSAGNASTLPVSNPKFANVTVLGPHAFTPGNVNGNYKNIIDANKFTRFEIYNSILGGFSTGVNFNSEDLLTANNNIFYTVKKNDVAVPFAQTAGTAAAGSSLGTTATITSAELFGANSLSMSGVPQAAQAASSPYKAGAPALPAVFEATDFYGAFGDNLNTKDWNFNSGWLNFDPINTAY